MLLPLLPLLALLPLQCFASYLRPGGPPFSHLRKSQQVLIPIDRDIPYFADRIHPGYNYNYTYIYQYNLGSFAEIYSFEAGKDGLVRPSLDQADASGFNAAIRGALHIETYPSSASPAGVVLLRAIIKVEDCFVQKGNAIGTAGLETVIDNRDSRDDCLPVPKQSENIVHVTQDVLSGRFLNTYYTPAEPQNGADDQDPLGYVKLVVGVLKSLQFTFKNAEAYEDQVVDRFGKLTTVNYRYIGTSARSKCWAADSNSRDEGEFASDDRIVCWANDGTGGVRHSSSGEVAELGTDKPQSEVVEQAASTCGLFMILSENRTLEFKIESAVSFVPNLSGQWIDIQGTNWLQALPLRELFTLERNGTLYRSLWQDSSMFSLKQWNPVPFSVLCGGPLVELPSQYRSQWALDTIGAIYEMHATQPVPQDSDPMPTWTNITNPENISSEDGVLELWPYHNINPALSHQFTLLAFYVSDSQRSYVVYRAGDNTSPSISDFPSVSRIDVVRKMIQLAPIAPLCAMPAVAGLDEDGQVWYSVWNTSSGSTLLNPADGFSEWEQLKIRGAKVRKIEAWHFHEGSRSEDGILVVLDNSWMLSYLWDGTLGRFRDGQFVMLESSDLLLEGSQSVVFDRSSVSRPDARGQAIAIPFAPGNATQLAYTGNGIWIAFESWNPFKGRAQVIPNQGYPLMTALGQSDTKLTNVTYNPSPPNDTNLASLSELPFDSPLWGAPTSLNFTTQDAQQDLQTLFQDLTDPSRLIAFRRNISLGRDNARNIVAQMIQGSVPLTNANQSSAVLDTLLQANLTKPVADAFVHIIDWKSRPLAPKDVRISAVQQSISMSCTYGKMVSLLTNISNGGTPSSNDELEGAASAVLGAFATKSRCSFDTTAPLIGHSSHAIVELLTNRTRDGERHEFKIAAMYGLANSRHPKAIDTAMTFLNHTSSELRVAAIRAIANVASDRASSILVHHSLHNDDPYTRVAGFKALNSHILRSPVTATGTVLRFLFHCGERRTLNDVNAIRGYLQGRIKSRDLDATHARIGLVRLEQVEMAIQNSSDLFDPVFTPLSWSKEFSGSNVQVKLKSEVTSDFSAGGAVFAADARVDGSLFQTDFQIAEATANAVWLSSGLMSLTLSTAVYFYDFTEMRQVPFYLVLIQYRAKTAFQLRKGDPCQLLISNEPALTTRETRSFISATYYYGIPLIANVNLNVQLMGWFEVGFGVQLVTQSIKPDEILPGQVSGYIRPAAGLGGQISANVEILVASGGIQGSLDFAQLAIPAGAGIYVASLSPFQAGFGDSIQAQGQFLSGSVNLWMSLWNCCCWSCGWSCCFRCGGSCSTRKTYTIFEWQGIRPNPFIIDDRSNLCRNTFSSLDKAPKYITRDIERTQMRQEICQRYAADKDIVTDDSDDFFSPDQHSDQNVLLNTCGFATKADSGLISQLKRGFNRYTMFDIAAAFVLPRATAILYDCATYPEVCYNTQCYTDYYPIGIVLAYTFQWDDISNTDVHRSLSLSRLKGKSPPGKQLDEVPPAKCIEGGCCARIQAVDATQNSAHGGSFRGLLNRAFGVPGSRSATGHFTINLGGLAPWTKARCQAEDFRLTIGGGVWLPPRANRCTPACVAPIYLMTDQTPSLESATMYFYAQGDDRSRVCFSFDDLVIVEYVPQIRDTAQTAQYSHLQHLAIGETAVVQDGNILPHFADEVYVFNSAEPSFAFRLNRTRFGMNDTLALAQIQIFSAYSHLISHPAKSIPQHQYDSSAVAQIDVSDPRQLESVFGVRKVLAIDDNAFQSSQYAASPGSGRSKHDYILEGIVPKPETATKGYDVVPIWLQGLLASYSPREIALAALLAVVSALYFWHSPAAPMPLERNAKR